MSASANHAALAICEMSRFDVTPNRILHTLYIAQVLHMGNTDGGLFLGERFYGCPHGPTLLTLRKQLEPIGSRNVPARHPFGVNGPQLMDHEYNYLKKVAGYFWDADDEEIQDLVTQPGGAHDKRFTGRLEPLSDRDIFEEFLLHWDDPVYARLKMQTEEMA